ncbi:MAG: hypothetical protein D6732_01755 [Methanobacteriota archaeon]|nr:MAG: hypothetical protein D6732_01755 [Euryarchaeota archaeon]
MDVRLKFREMVKYRAGALCLVGILSATYLHSTAFMSQFFYHSLVLGGIAALAIDAGVVAMSIFKDELLKNGELAWMVRVVTSLVLFASGVANMSEGFKSAYGITLTYETLLSLDALTIIQWLAGTIIFPILAYVMSDTIGTRNLLEYKRQMEQRQTGKKIPALGFSTNGNGTLDAANAKIQQNKHQRMAMLDAYLDLYPEATLAEMAKAIGVSSRETVRRYLAEMGRRPDLTRKTIKVSKN